MVYVVKLMATKDEESSKQLKQFEKLTPEQIVNGLRFWLSNGDEDSTPNPIKIPRPPETKK
jgi:hypothetical protein